METQEGAVLYYTQCVKYTVYIYRSPPFTFQDGNLSPAMGTRNQEGTGLSYRPASLWSLGYSIPDSFPGIDFSPHSGTRVFDSVICKKLKDIEDIPLLLEDKK
jgi:hypothetical protein